MIFPQQTDLGRRVIYRPPGAGRRYGVISAIYTRPCSSDSITRISAGQSTRPIWSLPNDLPRPCGVRMEARSRLIAPGE